MRSVAWGSCGLPGRLWQPIDLKPATGFFIAQPSAVAVGRQVMVHAPYTVTLPPVFGELFYAMGGRVGISDMPCRNSCAPNR